nr:MAG TPA: hypothetical protein [Caudoviricetes sp.]
MGRRDSEQPHRSKCYWIGSGRKQGCACNSRREWVRRRTGRKRYRGSHIGGSISLILPGSQSSCQKSDGRIHRLELDSKQGEIS